jgi:Amt family ammonium transporter
LSGLNKKDATNFVKGLVPVNTLIAASFGGLTSYVAYYLKKEKTSLISLSRGAVAGVVAVSASVDDI